MPNAQDNNLSEIVSFLSDLKENNNREWFSQNREHYEHAKQNFTSTLNNLIVAVKEFDSTLGILDAKDCIFRIYRDVRFSPNKDPYKINMGGFIARGGRKSPFAGYYFHLEPNASFVSGGIYMAPPEIMKNIRIEIDTYSEQFLAIVENARFRSIFPNLGDESLKRIPQGFSADSVVAKYLMLKHISPIQPLLNNDLAKQDILKQVVSSFSVLLPLVRFINRAIDKD